MSMGCLPPQHEDDQKRDLAHVRWIGGSPAAGKSTITRMLAATHSLTVYDFDGHESDHAVRRMTDAATYPAYASFLALTMDQRWLLRSIEDMAQQAIAMWTERFRLVVDDLCALPKSARVLTEGAGLFSECVGSLISSRRHAIWLVPTASFCREVRLQRDAGSFADTSDPSRALDNLIARDILLAQYVREQAKEVGLTVLEVDGTRSIERTASLVEQHLLLTGHSE